MKSELAKKFNSSYDRSQWMGEEYLLDEIKEMYELPKGKTLSRDVMFWMGYIYSYWAIMYNENCSRILKIAGPEKMAKNYAGLHTISNDLAIQELIAQSEKT